MPNAVMSNVFCVVHFFAKNNCCDQFLTPVKSLVKKSHTVHNPDPVIKMLLVTCSQKVMS